jgi:hypothetical protein
MPATPLSFICSLKKEADGFANMLTLLAVGVGGLCGVWNALVFFHLADNPVPHVLRLCTIIFCSAWFVFYAITHLIDYAIYAVARAATEWLDSVLNGVPQIDVDHAITVDVPTNQREAAVAYLHDILERRKATDTLPLTPPKGAA